VLQTPACVAYHQPIHVFPHTCVGVVVFTTNTDGCEEMYFMMQATRTELVQGLLKRCVPVLLLLGICELLHFLLASIGMT
jgi:hypothetical protein